jgi:MFS family permease
MILAGGFMMTAAVGSLPTVAIDVIHPGLRATAAAMVTVVQNLFGLAAGPFIAGALSDAFGLGTALALMPLFCLASAAVVIAGSRAYPRDLDRADAIPAEVAAA